MQGGILSGEALKAFCWGSEQDKGTHFIHFDLNLKLNILVSALYIYICMYMCIYIYIYMKWKVRYKKTLLLADKVENTGSL